MTEYILLHSLSPQPNSHECLYLFHIKHKNQSVQNMREGISHGRKEMLMMRAYAEYTTFYIGFQRLHVGGQ